MPKVTVTELNAAQKARLVDRLLQGLQLCDDEKDLQQWRKDVEPSVTALNDSLWVQHIEEAVIEHKCLITQNQMENNNA